ncbi:aminotransferase class I/II-fold pyridoxal phosphate-dependent enzyme [Clostridium hydrogenum]|uniref:aminotransferase class I/II-fold pyridoxal phosphate-dependent enzyme n=1 Tax=Clostridium hydrogenum TaxID=2855764 RepID=UPI002E309B83|nr:aminotransferase class V-fold PLP-dependent enzyme [Clostridium hydrogenum]
MSKLPLIDGVMKYIRENNSLLCMPGHKAGKGFLCTEAGKKFYDNVVKFDLTEVDGLDNLHHAEGIIKEAQEKLRDFYGTKKSYFLVNGSTGGNLAMIFASFNEGDKVIVERNCHRSIFNGIIMRKLKPVYIKNNFNTHINAPLSIDEEYFLSVLDKNSDAKGIIITYPNYYGVCCNLQFIANEAKKRGMKVLVDSAHGAHFGLCDELPESAVNLGCDAVVMSSHKTLPSFTQTSYLHLCSDDIELDKLDFYVSAFSTTSPSYMLMSSMDYARYYIEEFGREEYKKLIGMCNEYLKKINTIKEIHILNEEDLKKSECIDKTRFIINVSKGYSGFKLYNHLKNNSIQPEMCDSQNVILIFSPFNTEDEFEKLYEVIKNCNLDEIKIDGMSDDVNFQYISRGSTFPNIKMNPWEVFNKKGIQLGLDESEGCICKDAIVPYPPGVPILMPGEVISSSLIKEIKYYLHNETVVLGIEKGEKDNYLINIV